MMTTANGLELWSTPGANSILCTMDVCGCQAILFTTCRRGLSQNPFPSLGCINHTPALVTLGSCRYLPPPPDLFCYPLTRPPVPLSMERMSSSTSIPQPTHAVQSHKREAVGPRSSRRQVTLQMGYPSDSAGAAGLAAAGLAPAGLPPAEQRSRSPGSSIRSGRPGQARQPARTARPRPAGQPGQCVPDGVAASPRRFSMRAVFKTRPSQVPLLAVGQVPRHWARLRWVCRTCRTSWAAPRGTAARPAATRIEGSPARRSNSPVDRSSFPYPSFPSLGESRFVVAPCALTALAAAQV